MKENAIKALQLINYLGIDNSQWDVQKYDTAEDFIDIFSAKHPNLGSVEFPATVLAVWTELEDFDDWLKCNPDGRCMVNGTDVLVWEL